MLKVDLDYPALACGIERDEGVLVAYIPKFHDDSPSMYLETPYRDGKRSFTVYSLDGVVVDMLPHDNKPCKWWMVREAARDLKLDYPEPILACAAEDFRLSCLPKVPAKEGCDLSFRTYSRGPWIKLSDIEQLKEKYGPNGTDAVGSPPPISE